MKKITLEEHFSTAELNRMRQEWVKRMGPSAARSKIIEYLNDFEKYRLPEMDAHDIEVQVLSTSSPSVQGIGDAAAAVSKAIEVNDALADEISKHPSRFRGFATLPMQAPQAAAKELERTVTRLGFKGALIHGHTHYRYLDDRSMWPVWECAAALGVPIYLHPTESDPDQLKLYEGYPEMNGATWIWGVETGAHALRILLSGVFDQFPKAQLVIGHLGENIPYGLWRFESHWKDAVGGTGLDPATPKVKLKRLPSEYMRENVMLTTSGNFSNEALRCAIDVMGVDRIMFSVDYPFESTAEACEFIEKAPLSDTEREMICYGNAKKLLGL